MTRLTPDQLRILEEVPLLSALDRRGLDELLRSCQRQQAPRGSEVFGPDQPAEALYVVLTGRVKVFKLSHKGDEQVLHHMGPGGIFGEAAVLGGGNYPAFAEALEDATLLRVSRSTLLSSIARNPELALGLMAGLSSKLHEFARLIEQLSLKEVPARLADVLLALAARASSDTFELDRTKRQLAARIGTVAETLSRTLRKLARDRIVRVEGPRITILDRQALEDLAARG
jgi:CRP/FNR family transcriptional regulator